MKSYGVKFGDTFHLKKHNFFYMEKPFYSFFFLPFLLCTNKNIHMHYVQVANGKWCFHLQCISFHFGICFCFDSHNKICMVYLKHNIQNVNNNYTVFMYEGKCPPGREKRADRPDKQTGRQT